MAMLRSAIVRAVLAGLMTLLAGVIGLALDRPMLFPSLGPTAYILANRPHEPSSSFYNTVIGHLIGIAAAFIAVSVTASEDTPSVLGDGDLVGERLWASLIAVMLTVFVQLLLQATHPPAAATTLLITLGGFGLNGGDVVTIIAGVVIVATAGEAIRRLWSGRAGPAPAPPHTSTAEDHLS